MQNLIHKVVISKKAEFDCSVITKRGISDKQSVKRDIEEYITLNDRIKHVPYFRVDYIDEETGFQFKFLIRKSYAFGMMQVWELSGVCFKGDWDQGLEDMGIIKAWLDSPVDISELFIPDWVERLRNPDMHEGMKEYKITGLDKEDLDKCLT